MHASLLSVSRWLLFIMLLMETIGRIKKTGAQIFLLGNGMEWIQTLMGVLVLLIYMIIIYLGKYPRK